MGRRLPLFIVLVTCNVMSGEREQGTLRQLLSLGVKPRDLIAAKGLGIAAALRCWRCRHDCRVGSAVASGQDLDGHFAVEPRIARAIHLTHGARTHRAGHLEHACAGRLTAAAYPDLVRGAVLSPPGRCATGWESDGRPVHPCV
jgi:hypothetical protein